VQVSTRIALLGDKVLGVLTHRDRGRASGRACRPPLHPLIEAFLEASRGLVGR
jgi:hypothetical protein